MALGIVKLEWFGYSIVKRFEDTSDLFRQTDRQTSHDSIGRACIASRGKNPESFDIEPEWFSKYGAAIFFPEI